MCPCVSEYLDGSLVIHQPLRTTQPGDCRVKNSDHHEWSGGSGEERQASKWSEHCKLYQGKFENLNQSLILKWKIYILLQSLPQTFIYEELPLLDLLNS